MDFTRAQAYLYSFADYEKKDRFAYDTRTWNLTAFRKFLDELGAPDGAFSIAHVAGTNGKGAAAAALAALLTAGGKKAGLYTSPHLATIRERARVDGAMIPEAAFARLTGKLKKLQESSGHGEGGGYRTTFELLTALALLHFAEKGVEWAVLEVGLGGRLDATNVTAPEMCLFTKIALDHEGVLGEGLDAVAREKAGILKPGVPALSVPQEGVARGVLEARAAEVGTRVAFLGEGDLDGLGLDGERRVLWNSKPLALRGDFQRWNLGLALAAYKSLSGRFGLPADEKIFKRGLTGLRWPGRFEVVGREPLVVLDGGHNPAALAAIFDEIGRLPAERRFLVFGVSANKDLAGMCALAGSFDRIFLTQAPNPRAVAVEALGALLPVEKTVAVPGGPADALLRALDESRPGDLVLVAGSLYVAGEVKARAAELGLDDSLETWVAPCDLP
jgi:dihydrofolate synthase/folylpolyglutamate synthase